MPKNQHAGSRCRFLFIRFHHFATGFLESPEFALSQAGEHGMVLPAMVVTSTNSTSNAADVERPAMWRILMAFGIVYVGYGLNFLAVKIGVESMPAFLFAASHIFCAGVLLIAWQSCTRGRALLPIAGLQRAAIGAFFLFVGGVGLVTQGEKLGVPSGVAAVIKASVPLWVAVLEALRPRGERISLLMSGGLLFGAAGVVAIVLPRLTVSSADSMPTGTLLLVLSAFLFAIGSIFVRHSPPSDSPVTGAAWMMIFGGVLLTALGLSLGEASQIQATDFTSRTLGAFAFLLFVHSLAAFTAMNWLLRHLPASVVTTKFYVSPAVALLAGSLVLGEKITLPVIASLSLILVGVGIVLWGASRKKGEPPLKPNNAEELDT
jgi:drug/metabolite transporter (DMT)-like permease